LAICEPILDLKYNYDAVVVGAGPNGLAAAITLARAGLSVLLAEANNEIGGACRSAELTLPGFVHDSCSAIHPLAVGSPFFKSLPLEKYGLKWIQPELPLAHPLDDKCIALHRLMTTQKEELGEDGETYRRLMEPYVSNWPRLAGDILGPLLHLPRSPLLLAKFGLRALTSASYLARRSFKTESARALFGGLAAHSFLSLDKAASSATGLVLGVLAHAVGWPMPAGGAGMITRALGAYFQELGGHIITNHPVKNIDDLPPARAVFLDLTARQVLAIAGHRLSGRYRRALETFRYGAAVFKMDYALSSPIPWKHSKCAKAGTVHLGGTLSEIEWSEKQVSRNELPARPFVLVTQASLFDPTRAPDGKHTAWAYCHIPHDCDVDLTDGIEKQIERFAPGFRDCIIARCARGPRMLEKGNANLVGGDINGGLADLRQLMARPVLGFQPYKTPIRGTYICSASTPPGVGVHGMAGYNAASLALKNEFKIQSAP
jgi:phytoene dehydrogenase-like protein